MKWSPRSIALMLCAGAIFVLFLLTVMHWTTMRPEPTSVVGESATPSVGTEALGDSASNPNTKHNVISAEAMSAQSDESWLYDDSLPAQDVYNDLVARAEAGDGKAALRVIDIDVRCWSAHIRTEVREFGTNSIAEMLLDDDDGRMFFNLTLVYPWAEISEYDQLLSFMNARDFCEGFDENRRTDHWLEYLILAADAGQSGAQIALWRVPYTAVTRDLGSTGASTSSPILDGMTRWPSEVEWQEATFDYLKRAAESGDPRAFVLLGDAYSSGTQVNKNPKIAYAYYFLASSELDYLFLQESVNSIGMQLSDEEMRAAQHMIGHTFDEGGSGR